MISRNYRLFHRDAIMHRSCRAIKRRYFRRGRTMFNLEIPSVQWAIQVLTLDYLIDGSLDAERDKNSFRLQGHDVSPLPLTSARFRVAGALSVSPPPAIPWVLIYGDQLV